MVGFLFNRNSMTIELLSQFEYDALLDIQKNFPALTFQNEGYQYIDRKKFSEEEKKADEDVTAILKKHIRNFIRFDNFRIREKTGEIVIRFQYVWDPEATGFTGVGYITLRELFKGFDEDTIKAVA